MIYETINTVPSRSFRGVAEVGSAYQRTHVPVRTLGRAEFCTHLMSDLVKVSIQICPTCPAGILDKSITDNGIALS